MIWYFMKVFFLYEVWIIVPIFIMGLHSDCTEYRIIRPI